MKMYSKDGVEMMVIYSLEKEGSDLVTKGKMLRSMPATIYIRPEEVWRGLKLLSWRVIFCLPKMLLKGFWLNLKVKWGKK